MRIGANFCPGVLHAVPAKDGLLMRIRVPGGLIEAGQLRALAGLAAEYADGTLEITSRANLQVRAIRPANLDLLVDGVVGAGLLPSRLHDRVRNLVASPIAGLDPEELLDPRPLVRELDRRLSANPVFAELHPKFSFGIFGGPRRFSHDADDLALEAFEAAGQLWFRLTVAGAATAFAVAPAEAVDRLLSVAEQCIGLAQEAGVPVRARQVSAIPGAIERIAGNLAPTPLAKLRAVENLLGICATAQAGRVNLIPSVPLGRLSASQAILLADAADRWQADLRLGPWRGVVLGSVPDTVAAEIAAQLHSIGLSCDGRDGFSGIAACAGITGCDAALADVRGHAVILAQRLAGLEAPANWAVNLSGCDKQCGRRHGATVDLIADASGYILKLNGQVAATGCSPESAIHAVTTLHNQLLSEDTR